ncbi:unnamed protein product [Protopolystoma xenopodis]|uniref:Uncharacterized protein n=1 Tax=Protopolystoma xenopodis TaxID=117903 RepID=A0A3S5AQX2_9PLAT|nr:unnamed protein product [Protopolystoma xenopodis]
MLLMVPEVSRHSLVIKIIWLMSLMIKKVLIPDRTYQRLKLLIINQIYMWSLQKNLKSSLPPSRLQLLWLQRIYQKRCLQRNQNL